MRREPPSRQRRVALAGVDVNVSIRVLAVTVDDVFAGEFVVVLKWIVCPKSVGVDSQRLLLVVGEEESHCRFVSGFRWDNVSLSRSTVNDGEDRWFVSLVGTSSARGQATRARRLVALAAFQPCRDVHFVDFDRYNEVDVNVWSQFLQR